MQTISETKTHKLQTQAGARVGKTKEQIEIDWRNSELERTDAFMLLSDYPNKESLTVYRQELRDYPTSLDFPNGVRPTE